ncbi:solute carrier family 52, riboflavin transporter, member 3-B-like [Ptychodera flava]|uniref:solute carrier family 52, riboflavin transporter, member 3-B-like n=1 Tax=Ptychodera flava TaxID=63121 RepID=UPI00396A9465
MDEKSEKRPLSVIVQILVCLMGMASWIDINGLWVQLPLMVNYLPEGWNLPSYLVIIIQVANVGPLLFTITSRFTDRRIEIPTNYVIILVGCVSCILLAFYWDVTSYFGDEEHSTVLLCLSFCLALVDCTSSVSFLAFMSLFPLGYMTAYFIGEGLSGLIPSIIALIQGVGGNAECRNSTFLNETSNTTYHQMTYYYPPARFSLEVFFFILFAMLFCSFVSFGMLNHLPLAKREQVKSKKYEKEGDGTAAYGAVGDGSSETDSWELEKNKSLKSSEAQFSGESEDEASETRSSSSTKPVLPKNVEVDVMMKQSEKYMSGWDWVFLMSIQAWVNGLSNGVLPSVQSYSALPYGNVAYHLAVTLGQIANPAACLIVYFLPTRNIAVIGAFAFLGTGMASYIMWLALESPTPFLCGSVWGEVLVVAAWILMAGLFTYTKVMIGTICRDHGRKALIWCGAVMQAGSLIGSIIIFPLVNNLHLFTSNDPCGDTCWDYRT